MKKEELVKLGLTKEMAQKVADTSAEELKRFIPKTRFDDVNGTKKDLEQQIKDKDKLLKDLQEKAKENEDLEKTIKVLQQTNKTTKDNYESKFKNMTIDSAIQSKLIDTKYADLLIGRFDRAKLSVAADGTVLGIDEQLATIKETYKDLFTPVITGRVSNNIGRRQPPTGRRQELKTISKTQRHRLSREKHSSRWSS